MKFLEHKISFPWRSLNLSINLFRLWVHTRSESNTSIMVGWLQTKLVVVHGTHNTYILWNSIWIWIVMLHNIQAGSWTNHLWFIGENNFVYLSCFADFWPYPIIERACDAHWDLLFLLRGKQVWGFYIVCKRRWCSKKIQSIWRRRRMKKRSKWRHLYSQLTGIISRLIDYTSWLICTTERGDYNSRLIVIISLLLQGLVD